LLSNYEINTEKEQTTETKSSSTLPSYACFSNTSGAIYAGVPTVELGCECSIEDYPITKSIRYVENRAKQIFKIKENTMVIYT